MRKHKDLSNEELLAMEARGENLEDANVIKGNGKMLPAREEGPQRVSKKVLRKPVVDHFPPEAASMVRGYSDLGEQFTCPDSDYFPLADDSCGVADEAKAFVKACAVAGYHVSRCGCVYLCSTEITAPGCPEDARIDCLRIEQGDFETRTVHRSGFSCAFPPVPVNAADPEFCGM